MLSLYRRHRPRTFDEVVGQEHIVRTLRNAIELDKVHHAYLFVGSRGTGKTSMAKLLACALNAESGPTPEFDPEAPSAKAILAGTSLDVVEMDAASHNSVDDIRELRENVALAPMQGRNRVYILDEAHMLTTQAWNAFLKTLEEPPSHVVFVLATTEAHKVPPTIVDRCHRFDFHRPSLEQIAGVLRRVAAEEEIVLPEPAVGMLARAATGSFRDALGTLEQLVTYGGREVKLDDVRDILGVADAELVLDAAEALTDRDPRAALLAVQRLSDSGRDFAQFMRDLSAHLRHLFVVQTLREVPDSFSVTAEHTDRLRSQAERFSQAEILRAVDFLAAAIAAVKDGSEPRIQLEMALLKATQPQADMSLQALMFRIEQLEGRLGAGAAGESGVAGAPAPGDGARAAESPAHSGSGAGGAPTAPRRAAGGERGSAGAPVASGTSGAPVAERGSPGAPVPSGSTGAPVAERGSPGAPVAAAAAAEPVASAAAEPLRNAATALRLEQVQELWPVVAQAVGERNGMLGAALATARPESLEGGRLTIAFPADAVFAKKKAEAGRDLIQAALRGLTGHAPGLAFELSDAAAAAATTLDEAELVERLRAELGAEEVFDE